MMRSFFRATAICAALLLVLPAARAQTPLGQPTLDEQKVQVWCAAVRFVYEDNGRPGLKNTLRCGGSLKAFETSIRADSQRVFSALYRPLEGRGAIYQGLGSNPARLQKLKTEIISRLKSSAARRASPARMQRLTALETALTNYVQNGTPIGDQPEELTAETLDTTADTDEAAAATDAGLEEAGMAQPAAPARSAGESLMNKFFAPLALVMSLLSLVLYVLMRRNMSVFQKELSARVLQRQDELLVARPAPVAPATPAETVGQHLSPQLQHEVEQLVQQRVEAALARQATQYTPAVMPTESAAELPMTAALPVPVVAPVVASSAAFPVAEEATPSPEPSFVLSEAAPRQQNASGSGPQEPAGPLLDAEAADFDHLIPPVHLPDALPRPAAVSVTRYSKAPVDGLFQDADFTDEPAADSLYEIYLDPEWPDLASFQVSAAPAVQANLLPNAPDFLAETCEFELPAGAVTRIIGDEEGILRRVTGGWQIEQKALVQFEG